MAKHVKYTDDLPNEIWKPVVGYEGMYEVSNLGRVKTLPKIKGSVNFKNCYLLAQKTTKHGYLSVTLRHNKTAKYPPTHRLVAMAFIPNPDNKMEVNHIDTNKQNNHVSNLEWVTSSENKRHMIGIEKHHLTAFTWDQIRQIRALRGIMTQRAIADMFGVGHSCIGKIMLNQSYVE